MPNILARALTNLERAKLYLGISSDRYDGLLIMLINQATGFIEQYTKRTFLSQTYTNQEYDGTGSPSLVLRQYPVTAVTAIQYNQAVDNSDNWASFTSNEFFWESNGIIRLATGSLLPNTQKYRVTFTAGYLIDFANEEDAGKHTLPFELENLCLRIVSALYNRRKSEGYSNVRLGDASVTLNKVVMNDEEFRAVLDKYTNPSI